MPSRVTRVAPQVALACLACLGSLGSGATRAAEVPAQRVYVSASHLNMRAHPAPDAELLTRWKINQPLNLLGHAGPRWCQVEASPAPLDPALRSGYVDCRYLSGRPVQAADIEASAAELILALNRLVASGVTPTPYAELPWSRAFTDHADAARQLLDPLFDQMERHFALSPSMRTYVDYSSLLAFLSGLATPEHPLPAPLADLVGRRLAQLPALRAAFSADFAAQPAEPVRRALTASLSELIDARQGFTTPTAAAHRAQGEPPRAAGPFDRAAPPPGRSFFSGPHWVIGWAPLLTQGDDTRRGEAVYRFHYTGSGPWAVGDTIEMAKALRGAVRTSFRYLPRGSAGVFEASTVQTDLPAWAITDQGLQAGRLRKVVFAGDACSSGAADTAAEFVFARPLPAVVHGVFVSSAPIDPARARVSVQRRRFLAPLLSDDNTLTDEAVVEVDLDGDGIADLRSRVATDTNVSALTGPRRANWLTAPGLRVGPRSDSPGNSPSNPHGNPHVGAHLLRVGGWTADDVESLEANQDGRWQLLSLYDVVSCP